MKDFLKDLQDVLNKHKKELISTKAGIIIKDSDGDLLLGTNQRLTASDRGNLLITITQFVD